MEDSSALRYLCFLLKHKSLRSPTFYQTFSRKFKRGKLVCNCTSTTYHFWCTATILVFFQNQVIPLDLTNLERLILRTCVLIFYNTLSCNYLSCHVHEVYLDVHSEKTQKAFAGVFLFFLFSLFVSVFGRTKRSFFLLFHLLFAQGNATSVKLILLNTRKSLCNGITSHVL